jgi:hypothetical protein
MEPSTSRRGGDAAGELTRGANIRCDSSNRTIDIEIVDLILRAA